MNKDLKIIKKKFGEKFSHMCRELFPTILEEEGKLVNILLDNFHENHFLYDDIINNALKHKFKEFIYSLVNVEDNHLSVVNDTPYELMEKVGYILTKCDTEEELQRFRKYYARGEELCTFNDNRLKRCEVFFAVKKNVDEIKRKDFDKPDRQDLYGTSVISIQFTKDGSHTLSIKNRYNHTVNNPDATFSNNLDNIIYGLTDSFAKYYGLIQRNINNGFEIPGYVRASDGKFYKYRLEHFNVYYCHDNIIMDNFEVKKYDKSRYILIEYFIIDMVDKKIYLYENRMTDSFANCIDDIVKISVDNIKNGKKFVVEGANGEKLVFNVNQEGKITVLDIYNIERIGNDFLYLSDDLVELNMSNVKYIGDKFLYFNSKLAKIDVGDLLSVDSDFLHNNRDLEEFNARELEHIGGGFIYCNEAIGSVYLPNVRVIGNGFLFNNRKIRRLDFPNLVNIKNDFMRNNIILEQFNAPRLENIGLYFLRKNLVLKELNLPNLKKVDNYFLITNMELERLITPNLEHVGLNFLKNNYGLKLFVAPKSYNLGIKFFDDVDIIDYDTFKKMKIRRVEK